MRAAAANGARALGAAALALALQGCVAAIVPLAAGAMVGKSRLDSDRPAAAAPAAAPVQTVAAPAPARREPQVTVASGGLVVTDLTALPRPGAGEARAGAGDAAAVGAFVSHAEAALAEPAPAAGRRSAVLANPQSLDPARAACGDKPPAVLVDLDPGYGVFDPYTAGAPHPLLGPALAQLRGQGVTVFWSTRLGEAFALPLREALVQSGLDPEGGDRLLVMHSIDERKQTRRADAAQTHCLVAVVGDERGDFDELYLYLRDPAALVITDSLIGDGWFLIDPFPPAPPQTEGPST